MKISAYLQGAIATALVEQSQWSVIPQHNGRHYRYTIVVPGRGTFFPTFGDSVEPLWFDDADMAYRAAVAEVAASYYAEMVAQRTVDRRRVAEDRMPRLELMQ